jgi:hypothetical protein
MFIIFFAHIFISLVGFFHALPSPEEIQGASQQQVLEDGTWCREQQLLFRPGRTEAVGTTG